MNRTILGLGLLVAGCATEAVRTPEQAESIARSSVCAQREVSPVPNETLPTSWLAKRKGDSWYAWLPFGPGAQYPGISKYGHMGAWINAKDGKIISCEGGASRPLGQAAPLIRVL
jgi:hypothetical protein